MDEARLVPPDGDGHTGERACVDDSCGPLNIWDIAICLLLFLVFLGFMKGILGLMCSCVGTFGISRLLISPRKLDQYYESELQDREVEYDDDDWPVHPDTRKRTVQLVSWPIQFLLNLIFFICAPFTSLISKTKTCKCTSRHTCGSDHCHMRSDSQRDPLLRGESSRSTSSFRRPEDSSAPTKSKSSKSRSKWRSGLSGSSN